MSSLTGVTAIAAGGNFAMALKDDGTVRAWGEDEFGQAGSGLSHVEPSPILGGRYLTATITMFTPSMGLVDFWTPIPGVERRAVGGARAPRGSTAEA